MGLHGVYSPQASMLDVWGTFLKEDTREHIKPAFPEAETWGPIFSI